MVCWNSLVRFHYALIKYKCLNWFSNQTFEHCVHTHKQVATYHVGEINFKAKRKGLDTNRISIAFQWSLKIASFFTSTFYK